MTSWKSYDNVINWFNDAKENVLKSTIFVLVGNKIDLNEEREVSYEEGKFLMEKLKMDMFFETSAKLNIEIDNMF